MGSTIDRRCWSGRVLRTGPAVGAPGKAPVGNGDAGGFLQLQRI
jgi:hypothetical protein